MGKGSSKPEKRRIQRNLINKNNDHKGDSKMVGCLTHKLMSCEMLFHSYLRREDITQSEIEKSIKPKSKRERGKGRKRDRRG